MSTNKAKKRRLGILLCGHTPSELLSKHGTYVDKFITLLGPDAFDYVGYHVVDSIFPDSIHDADGWLLTGSKHGVYEEHSWIPVVEEFVREAYAADVPLVGVCFGHQLLAQALGGSVSKFDGGWSVGTVEYNLEWEGRSEKSVLNAYHQDQVQDLPPDAKVIGSTDFCEYAALVYGNKALSFQPHPEFEDEYVDDLLITRGHLLSSETREQAARSLGQKLDSQIIAKRIRDFINRD